MAVTIRQKFIHMAPRKLRSVAGLVRGQKVELALSRLAVEPRIAVVPVKHAIKSAVNAAKAQNLTNDLIVSQIFVDEGPALKRRILKSRGRSTRMEHRFSHITVVLDSAKLDNSKAEPGIKKSSNNLTNAKTVKSSKAKAKKKDA